MLQLALALSGLGILAIFVVAAIVGVGQGTGAASAPPAPRNSSWFSRYQRPLFIVLGVLGIAVLLYFGVHSSSLESPSLKTVWEATINHWFLILLVLGLAYILLSIIPKDAGAVAKAKVLKGAIVWLVPILFVGIPLVYLIWGDKPVAPQTASATPKCTSIHPCDGSTERVSIPKGKRVCFDDSFWDNLDRLGYTTSYQGGPEKKYGCTREQVISGVCHERTGDTFRFIPAKGVQPPRYWFTDEGGSEC
ncbi:hypothetical protein KGQ72_02285 [Patescibacteria group bacterium]|nr:hypothetical protein [Patescibacteria group bacterium]